MGGQVEAQNHGVWLMNVAPVDLAADLNAALSATTVASGLKLHDDTLAGALAMHRVGFDADAGWGNPPRTAIFELVGSARMKLTMPDSTSDGLA